MNELLGPAQVECGTGHCRCMAEIQNIPLTSYLRSARGKDVDSGMSLTTTTVCLDVVSTCKGVMFGVQKQPTTIVTVTLDLQGV